MSEAKPDYTTRAKTIFRVEKNADNPFVMIDRRVIENPKLSWKAKGLLAYLLSRPDNWVVRFGDLAKRAPDGGHTVRAAMKELKAAGHVKVVAERENGRVKQWTYTVFESPVSPDVDFQQVEKQDVENRTLNDTDSNETELTNGVPPTFPVEWQIAGGNETVTMTDEKYSQRIDAANLIATGTGTAFQDVSALVMAFQMARDKTFTMDDIKGQRKAAKVLMGKGVKPEHVTKAVRKLIEAGMTVTDLYSIIKTADDLANPPPEASGYNPQGLEIKL